VGRVRLPFGFRLVRVPDLSPSSVHVHVTAAPSTLALAEKVRADLVRRYEQTGARA
jgi:hypothetical protein